MKEKSSFCGVFGDLKPVLKTVAIPCFYVCYKPWWENSSIDLLIAILELFRNVLLLVLLLLFFNI